METKAVRYVILKNDTYEFLDDENYPTSEIMSATIYPSEQSALNEIHELDEPDIYDVVEVTFYMEYKKCLGSKT